MAEIDNSWIKITCVECGTQEQRHFQAKYCMKCATHFSGSGKGQTARRISVHRVYRAAQRLTWMVDQNASQDGDFSSSEIAEAYKALKAAVAAVEP